jgi:F-type H+-transporting ATPase subunit b
MLHSLIIASSNQPSLFEALGINWKLLVEQAIAFLILVFILGKFVYPALIKAIDARRDQIEAGLQEAKQSQEALEQAEARVADMIEQARKDADDVIARSHQEAVAMVTEAEDKAKQRADQIVKDARAQLDIDVTQARKALRDETVKLVAAATEHVVGEKLDDRKDAGLITKALDGERA